MDVRLALRALAVTWVGAMLATVVATSLALTTTHQAGPAIALRAVLVTVVLLLLLPALVRPGLVELRHPPLVSVLVGSGAAYLLDPFAWSGRGYALQLVLHPGLITLVLDLVLWLAVTAGAVAWRLGSYEVTAPSRTSQGYLP
ncbi:MAG: hypothetical protein ACTHLJ_07830 [Angustibacter sp.]